MKTIFLLMILTAFCLVAASMTPELALLYPVALLLVIAFLLIRRFAGTSAGTFAASPKLEQVVIDGSNVMYWKDNTPRIETVLEVVAQLSRRGLTPGVIFDANAGYLLTERYQHDRFFSQALGLPQNRVMVVPKGTPADPFILTAARDLGARIVTNDRFRDWAAQFPEVKTDGHLIPGGYGTDGPWFALDTERA